MEFYQDGIGWVPFEVTPPYIDRMEQPDIFQGYDTGENESDGDDKASEEMTEDNYIQSEEKERPDVRETAKTAALALLGLLLAAILFLLARYLKKQRELRQPGLTMRPLRPASAQSLPTVGTFSEIWA